MAKLTLKDPGANYRSTDQIKSNNDKIESAIENTLSRDGTGPNQMEANLDMNSNRVLNLPEPTSDSEPYRKIDIDSGIGPDITTVATNIADVSTVADDIVNVNTVAADLSGDDTVGAVASVINAGSPGLVSVVSAGTAAVRSIGVGTGLSITNASGAGGNPTITLDADLSTISQLTETDGAFIVGSGSGWVVESGDTALGSLGATALGTSLLKSATESAARGLISLDTTDSPTFDGLTITNAPSIQGRSVNLSGGTDGQVVTLRTGAFGLETPAGGGDLLAAADETVTGDYTFTGSTTVSGLSVSGNISVTGTVDGRDIAVDGAKLDTLGTGTGFGDNFEVVQPAGTASATRTAITDALTAVGVGGTVMLASGETFQINGDITLSTNGQVLHIPQGTVLQSDGSTRRSVRLTGDDCTVIGSGELDKIGIVIGVSGTKGSGLGSSVLGNLKIKDPTTRAVNVSDAYDDAKRITIEGVRVYWSSAGVTAAKAVLPLLINVDTIDSTETLRNVLIKDCVVDYKSSWTLEDLAEVQYPSSGNPNTIGIRIRANNESIARNWTVVDCTVLMPEPTSGSSFDPVTYGNVADGAGRRRPTCYEITAVRSTVNHSGKTGTFTAGETVTGGTTGATCLVGSDSASSFKAYSESGHFSSGETLTGGTSGATATFVSREGHHQDCVFDRNYAFGGDLQYSFGKGHNLQFNNNRAEGNATSYCLEYANGESISGSGNRLSSALAGKALSCTNTRNVNLPASFIETGSNTVGFTDSNTGITAEGVNNINLSGSTVKAAASSQSLMKIRGSTTEVTLNLSGTTWIGTGYSSIQGVHFDQGTAHTINLSGAAFIDISGSSILIDSGLTLNQLITIGCSGFNAGAFTNNGTITNHINHSCLGISGLGGDVPLLADSNTFVKSGANLQTVESTDNGAILTCKTGRTGDLVSGLRVDNADDTSRARIAFQKAGSTRGAIYYQHASGGGAEYYLFDVASTYKYRMQVGRFLINGDETPTAPLDIIGDKIRLRNSSTPASATAAGNVGDITWDSSYIYVCVASNTWKRSALSTW